ncbi:hypothetical protein Cgig2_012525 [Carnegiea gigantea]|uniref:Uncharacterized protein n=1 Tax=Carnegiea gigantea TaxID=171969 RepID=A0A9Q1GG88_9CARY|nr:hypothetical protein Cgig2_012525 [Carnegiea gigantea]
MATSLSDHTPILIRFPTTTKPRTQFQFCDMWCKHLDSQNIITSALRQEQGLHEQKDKAKRCLEAIQQYIQGDPRNTDLQQWEKEARNHYISIFCSVMNLMRQQSKLEWIKYGDDYTKLFFAIAKQRKIATYVYTITNEDGRQMEGFDQVGKEMLNFYKNLLGKQFTPRSSIDPDVIKNGPVLTIEQQQALTEEFSSLDIKEALFSIPSTKSPGPMVLIVVFTNPHGENLVH